MKTNESTGQLQKCLIGLAELFLANQKATLQLFAIVAIGFLSDQSQEQWESGDELALTIHR